MWWPWKATSREIFFPFGRISGPVLDGGMSDPLQQLRQRCVLLTGGISCTTGNPDKSQAEAGGWWLRHVEALSRSFFFPDVYIRSIYMCDFQIRYAFWLIVLILPRWAPLALVAPMPMLCHAPRCCSSCSYTHGLDRSLGESMVWSMQTFSRAFGGVSKLWLR